MISAMPAVALRRERHKGPNQQQTPQQQHGTSGKSNGKSGSQTPALVEYYNNKIARFAQTRRTYSTSTSLQSPDTDAPTSPPAEPESRTRRLFGHVTVFHLGCTFLAAGLIMLFVSVGSIKGDVTPVRAVGSFFVCFGALLCLVRTVCVRRVDPLLPMALRQSESFSGARSAPTPTTPTTPASPTDDDDSLLGRQPDSNGGLMLVSPDSAPTPADRSPACPETEVLLSPENLRA